MKWWTWWKWGTVGEQYRAHETSIDKSVEKVDHLAERLGDQRRRNNFGLIFARDGHLGSPKSRR